MAEREPDPAELVGELADFREWIRQGTSDLLWWTSLTLFGAVLLGHLVLGGVALAVLAAVWLLRRHQVVWTGVGLIMGTVGLVVYGVREYVREPSTMGFVDVGLATGVTFGLAGPTWAAIRYRRLLAVFEKRVGGADSPTSHNRDTTIDARSSGGPRER